jgi:hypothetical protein
MPPAGLSATLLRLPVSPTNKMVRGGKPPRVHLHRVRQDADYGLHEIGSVFKSGFVQSGPKLVVASGTLIPFIERLKSCPDTRPI